MKMKLKVLLTSIVFLAVTGGISCSKSPNESAGSGATSADATLRSKAANSAAGDSKSAAAAAPVKADPPCADGKQPVAVAGTCGGTWKFVKPTGGQPARCDFAWKLVNCENQGHKPDKQAACYGVLSKQVDSPDNADCSRQFGDPPQVATYNLKCCPR